MGRYNTHNFHVCQYRGADHLCMFQGNQRLGYARGHYLIMDQNYNVVQTVEAGNDAIAGDQHEFRLIDDGEAALITVYQPKPFDLTRINIKGQGWVQDGVFQEINVTSGQVLFSWSALEHLDPYTSYVYPKGSDVAGDGLSPNTPWDWVHINSVDKSTLTGNYLVSARHLGTIFYIDGSDGSIIWRLESGGRSDFDCTNFGFSFQHDAEIRHENATHMVFSFYDNASNMVNRTDTKSAGRIITLDYEARTATETGPSLYWPKFEVLSASQGNMQVLSNGNMFTCYGDWPLFAEFAADGTPVWAGSIGVTNGKVMVYRAYSSLWHAIPADTRPSLWTFSRDSDSLIALYVSWNGATEVASWTYYGANDMNEAFVKFGQARKLGFETVYTAGTHYKYTFVEAIGYDGSSLRNSTYQETFVPSAEMAADCTKMSCGPAYWDA